ncbi:type II secretion system F family protein [Pseudocolwellia agarivorans]|uniref:type II secretion system F family protein n=1 Tax=Pseudocolwellia agarivorans TaxID=1911682 RepID=UPI00098498ED|nr:type II secretion system F family protein [Pseudocolwellia agarivorans]
MSQLFRYKAYDRSGKNEEGEISAQNKAEAEHILLERDLLVIKISPIKLGSRSNKVSLADIEQSTEQLAILLNNGLKIDKALEVLAKTNSKSGVGRVWKSILDEIKKGKSLSESIETQVDIFSSLYCEMVKIGESTGNLPIVFTRLSENLRFQISLRSKVLQAISYPFFILLVCVSAIWAIFNFVVPSMSTMFESMEEVPSYTQFLLDVSQNVQEYQIHAIVVVFTVIFSGIYFFNQPKTRNKFIAFMVKLPLIKGITNKADRIRFATALQLTLESGVNLSSALKLAGETVIDVQLKQKLATIASQVSSGSQLSDGLQTARLFDDVALSLVAVGEESGTLDNSFREIASRSRQNFESWLMRFTALLEPLLILIMGGVVGSVVIIMLLSIVSINDVSF